MKKLFAISLALGMIFAVAACGGGPITLVTATANEPLLLCEK